MSYLSDLTDARDAAATKLKGVLELDEEKPSYSVDGRSMSWTEYQAFLRDTIRELNQDIINASNAEVHTHLLG